MKRLLMSLVGCDERVMTKRFFIFAVFAVIAVVFGEAGKSFAYRPLGTEDAGVAGKGVAQMELSYDYMKWGGDKDKMFLLVPIYGFTGRLELSAEIPYSIHEPEGEDSQNGIGDINLAAKYLLLKEGEKNPALALKGMVKLDTGDYDKGLGSGDKDYSMLAVASKTFGNLTAHAHLGYTFIGDKNDEKLRNIYLYGTALDYGITEAFHLVGEINGSRHSDRMENNDPRNLLSGFTYKFSEKFTFDFAVRRGLTSSTTDWSMTTGVSITF